MKSRKVLSRLFAAILENPWREKALTLNFSALGTCERVLHQYPARRPFGEAVRNIVLVRRLAQSLCHHIAQSAFASLMHVGIVPDEFKKSHEHCRGSVDCLIAPSAAKFFTKDGDIVHYQLPREHWMTRQRDRRIDLCESLGDFFDSRLVERERLGYGHASLLMVLSRCEFVHYASILYH